MQKIGQIGLIGFAEEREPVESVQVRVAERAPALDHTGHDLANLAQREASRPKLRRAVRRADARAFAQRRPDAVLGDRAEDRRDQKDRRRRLVLADRVEERVRAGTKVRSFSESAFTTLMPTLALTGRRRAASVR
jgi:hypothetical protein